jgi:ABC-type Na+ efflux pump permease subunit
MQKIATRVFIYSSIAFGVTGILLILAGGPDTNGSLLNLILHKLLLATVFVILPSFALSVAGKYLNTNS